MRKCLEALEKLDHTICLNLNRKGEGKLKFGLDDLDGVDCKDFDEFDECIDVIEKDLKAFNALKHLFKIISVHTYYKGYNLHLEFELDGLKQIINKDISKETYDFLKERL